ncbi:MAG TPA: signal peptidase I, partial [Bdellovibrionota bacterium]|nr:signal peptidase I [Bdellovibrionota bacterium]
VVFTDPRDGRTNLIKRLAGLPGDRVLVKGRAVAVPPDHYYFLGDNRDRSADSRQWGFVHRSALLGKARAVLYSVHWENGLPRPDLSRAGRSL